MTSKLKCELLKMMRREIAKANGIELPPLPRCPGYDCKGHCPECDKQAVFLNQSIDALVKEGKTVILDGYYNKAFEILARIEENLKSGNDIYSCQYNIKYLLHEDQLLYTEYGNAKRGDAEYVYFDVFHSAIINMISKIKSEYELIKSREENEEDGNLQGEVAMNPPPEPLPYFYKTHSAFCDPLKPVDEHKYDCLMEDLGFLSPSKEDKKDEG